MIRDYASAAKLYRLCPPRETEMLALSRYRKLSTRLGGGSFHVPHLRVGMGTPYDPHAIQKKTVVVDPTTQAALAVDASDDLATFTGSIGVVNAAVLLFNALMAIFGGKGVPPEYTGTGNAYYRVDGVELFCHKSVIEKVARELTASAHVVSGPGRTGRPFWRHK